jgi:NhaA family Na+:H+ antiporter
VNREEIAMNQHILPATVIHGPRIDRRAPVRAFRFVLNRFLLLPLGALVALVWANTEPEGYFRMSQALAFPVNEIGMAFFLALVAQEVYEALMPGGALNAWRHWSLPVAGALGGVAGSVATFFVVVGLKHEAVLSPAWPVAAAVDVAAGYYLLRLIYPHRNQAIAFLLVLSVVTDVIVMAFVAPLSPIQLAKPAGPVLLVVAVGAAAVLKYQRMSSFWPYLLGAGSVSWLGLYSMGIHPALALIPLVPLLPHDPRRREIFADRPDDTPVHYGEHEWNGVAQVALFLFGLVNAGVVLRHFDTGSWTVMLASLLGRPIGILGAIGFAVAAGLRLPRKMHWRDLAVIAVASSSGFTFALFMASAALPAGAVAEQITVGALATVAGAGLALGAAWLLGVGRFAAPHRRG